ncbi:MAG: hypothetical protein WCO69_03875, partial [Candidatus Omnitrophota bacterium]
MALSAIYKIYGKTPSAFVKYCLPVLVTLLFLPFNAHAANIQAVLDSKTGSSSFSVQNSDSIDVARIDSLGTALFTGNTTVDGRTTVNNGLIVSADVTFNNGMGVSGHSTLATAEVTGGLTAGNLTSGATTITGNMAITNASSLGIGTITPGASLDIRNGGVRIWDGVTSSSNIPDHVTGVNDLYVQGKIEVDGDVYLGDASTDNLVVNGQLQLKGDTVYTGGVTIDVPSTTALHVKNGGTDEFIVDTQNRLVHSYNNAQVDGSSLVSGKMTVSHGLTVQSDTTLDGNALVSRLMTVSNGLTVTSDTTLNGRMTVAGDASVGLPRGAYPSLNPDLFIQGNVETDGTLYSDSLMLSSGNTVNQIVNGNIGSSTQWQLPTALAVKDYVDATAAGWTKVGSNIVMIDTSNYLGVGTTIPRAKMEVTGGMTVTGDVTVAGLMMLSNGLTVTSDVTVNGSALVEGRQTINHGLVVASDTTINGNMLITSGNSLGIGTMTPETSLDIRNTNVRIWDGAFDATGNTNANGLTYANGPNDLYVKGKLEVDGDVYLGDHATADNLTITGKLDLTGQTNYNSPLSVTTVAPDAFLVRRANGDNTFNVDTQGRLATMTGSMTVTSDSTVAGLMTVSNGLTVTSDTTVNGSSLVSGRMTVSSGLTVTSDTTVVGSSHVTGLMT